MLLQCLAELTRELGKFPTSLELRLAANSREGFPTDKTFLKRFGPKAGMLSALRRWIEQHPDQAELAALLPVATSTTRSARAREVQEGATEATLSSSYVPPVIACLSSLARMEPELPIEFERRVAVAFEILGLEVQRLGQGSGREPDGIAKSRQHGWAVIYDAKARAGIYRIQTEDRKFREYIERYAHQLRGEGMARIYFTIVGSEFSESDLPKARELVLGTDVKSVALMQAEALVSLVERHLRSPLGFGLVQYERAFSETRIVGTTEVGSLGK